MQTLVAQKVAAAMIVLITAKLLAATMDAAVKIATIIKERLQKAVEDEVDHQLRVEREKERRLK